eukprot:766524-Hanusia_phi.AAC.1
MPRAAVHCAPTDKYKEWGQTVSLVQGTSLFHAGQQLVRGGEAAGQEGEGDETARRAEVGTRGGTLTRTGGENRQEDRWTGRCVDESDRESWCLRRRCRGLNLLSVWSTRHPDRDRTSIGEGESDAKKQRRVEKKLSR